MEFSQPVPVYVDNFLGFGVGASVPSGYYDTHQGVWVPNELGNGVVLRVLPTTDADGGAELDLDGDGAWTSSDQTIAATQGIALSERVTLRARYSAGASLWRFRVSHFTPWDANWGIWPPNDAKRWSARPVNVSRTDEHVTVCHGSVIECQNRTLGESIPLEGVGAELVHWSDRTAAYSRTLDIPYGTEPNDIPASLIGIAIEIYWDGVRVKRYLVTDPASYNQHQLVLSSGVREQQHVPVARETLRNGRLQWTWDGLDRYGRPAQGARPVVVRVGYVYRSQPARVARFGYYGNGTEITEYYNNRAALVLWNEWRGTVGGWDQRAQGLGGWSLGIHHAYDPRTRTTYLGSGGRRTTEAVGRVVSRVADGMTGSRAENIPLASAQIDPRAFDVAADGGIWFSEDCRIRRVTPQGNVVTVAGDLTDCGCDPDGPVGNRRINAPGGIAVIAPNVVAFTEPTCHRVRIIDGDQIITVGGTGYYYLWGDPLSGVATEVPMSQPEGISWSREGYLLVADRGGYIRRIDPFIRQTRVVAGAGHDYQEDVDANSSVFFLPMGVTALRDGGFAFTEAGMHRVFRVGMNGVVRRVAGNGAVGFTGDLGAAREAQLSYPTSIQEMADGSLIFVDANNQRVRQIDNNGIIRTVLGAGGTAQSAWGVPPTQWNLSANVLGISASPDGSFLFSDYTRRHLGRVEQSLPGFGQQETVVASEDGSELYGFDGATGCHLRTLDALTGQRRYLFQYESGSCRLARVVIGADAESNAIDVVRSGTTVRLRGPFYGPDNTEENVLTLDGNGNLDRVVHADQTWEVTHSPLGLLTELVDPLLRTHTFAYDESNLLTVDQNAAGGVTRLSYPVAPSADETRVARIVGALDATGPTVVHRVLSSGHFITETPAGAGGAIVTTDTTDTGNGVVSTEVRSGTTVLSSSTAEQQPDPRFGMHVPLTTRRTVTVGGRTITTLHGREVGLAPGSQQLAWQSDTWGVEGESAPRVTERFDASHGDCGGHGRLLSTTRGGRATRACLNASGRVERVEVLNAVPAMNPVVYGYDARGRVETVTQGERRVRTSYRTDGRVEATTLEACVNGAWGAQASTGASYDPTTRRPTSLNLPGGLSVGLNVDAMHQLRGLTPPSRDAHTMGYDGESRMNAFTSPAPAPGQPALTLGWRFNARGQLDRVTRADGSLIETTFDPLTAAVTDVTFPGLGALHRERLPMTGATDWVRAPNGCRQRVGYEGGGEMVPVSTTLESVPGETCPVSGSVAAGLNALGETSSMTVTGALAVTFTRDVDPDRLLTNAGGMTITPDPATGRMTGTSIGVVSTTQTYSADGVPDVVNATVSGSTELNFVYNLDARGRMGTVSESGHFTRDTTYVYDAAGRLWQVWRGGALVEQYDHVGSDGANGNRTAWTAGGSTFTATYDGQDRLQSYTENGAVTELGYDAHGNVATRTSGSAVTTYTWDPRGPLASVQRPGGAALIEYVLDPSGRRVGRKVGGALERGWLYAGGLLPVAETDGDGSTVRRVFVYATRGHVPDLVRQREGESWVIYRVLTDHLGSVRAVANTTTGQVVQRMDYDAFGRVVGDEVASGWTALPFGYAGGLYDRDTGLVRFGAREYDARIGRWVSRDPILFGGGDTNLYRYCGGDPVNRVDPTGLIGPVIFVGVGILIGYEIGSLISAASTYRSEEREQTTADHFGYSLTRIENGRHGRLASDEAVSQTYVGDDVTGAYHCIFYCQWAQRDIVGAGVASTILGAADTRWDARANRIGLSCGADSPLGGRDECVARCGAAWGNHYLREWYRSVGYPTSGVSDQLPSPSDPSRAP